MRTLATTVLWTLTILSVFALYAIKTDTRRLEARAKQLDRETHAAGQRVARLRARWGELTRPERIERLAIEHLGYGPLAPGQFAALGDLVGDAPPSTAPKPGARQPRARQQRSAARGERGDRRIRRATSASVLPKQTPASRTQTHIPAAPVSPQQARRPAAPVRAATATGILAEEKAR
ncbi:MAG: hypothetical protein AAFQ42_07870 [Pseudomonadota bacterium]